MEDARRSGLSAEVIDTLNLWAAFVYMDRAAIGLGGVFLHLKAEINWHRMFHELIEGFDTAKLRRRQSAALRRAGVPLP